MIKVFRRTPYAVLLITLVFVFTATWLASTVEESTTKINIEEFTQQIKYTPSTAIVLTNYNTYWIGARDGNIYLFNMMRYTITTYPDSPTPLFPTDHNKYSPFLQYTFGNNSVLSAKQYIEEALAKDPDDYFVNLFESNPVIVEGATVAQIIEITSQVSPESSTSIIEQETTTTIKIFWRYTNTEMSILYSYLQLNAEQINPLVYYRVAYAFRAIQMAKLAAFYYRYNVFFNSDGAFTTTYTWFFGDITNVISYNYNYGDHTSYDLNNGNAFFNDEGYVQKNITLIPLFFNNQTFEIKVYQSKKEINSTSSRAGYVTFVHITGEPYPQYNDFTEMLKAAEIFLQNYGPNDGKRILLDSDVISSTLASLTNILFYTYTNQLYPTALIYAYTGISPEPFPGFNAAFRDGNPRITDYEYFMPIYPAFIVPKTYIVTATMTTDNMQLTSTTSYQSTSLFTATYITYSHTGKITVETDLPIVISKGEATKTIVISIVPKDSIIGGIIAGDIYSTTIITTYRCISERTITIHISTTIDIPTVTEPHIRKTFYVFATISEEFPLYPTAPLYEVDKDGTTKYLSIKLKTTNIEKTLVITTYISTPVMIENSAGKVTIWTLSPSITVITLTFTETSYDTIVIINTDTNLTAETPSYLLITFMDKRNFFTLGQTSTVIEIYKSSQIGGKYTYVLSKTTLSKYDTIIKDVVHVYTRTITTTDAFEMKPNDIDLYLLSLSHYFIVSIDNELGLPLGGQKITYYNMKLAVSPTIINGTQTYMIKLIVEPKELDKKTISMVSRNPYVTAMELIAKIDFDVSTSVTSSTETKTIIKNTVTSGTHVKITTYTLILHETTYYWTTLTDSIMTFLWTTIPIETESDGTTFINTTLTSTIDTYVISAMTDIYNANRDIAFYGEILATRLAAVNMLVGYAEMDHYFNLVDIRQEWILHPIPYYFSSYSILLTSSATSYVTWKVAPGGSPTPVTQYLNITYYTHTPVYAVFAIDTAYKDSFEALCFKAPASPRELFLTLLKINYPIKTGLAYTTYYLTTEVKEYNTIMQTTDSNGLRINFATHVTETFTYITSKKFENAAAFVLLTETANPNDAVPINYVYGNYTTTIVTIRFADYLEVIVPSLIRVQINTYTTYPAMQYFLSETPYVYIIPLPTSSQTVTLSYSMTTIDYDTYYVSLYYYITTKETVDEKGNKTFIYVQTSVPLVQKYSASSYIAYISPVYMGVYVLYGMTNGSITISVVTTSGSNTIKTETIITDDIWINQAKILPWFQRMVAPVKVTRTQYVKVYISGSFTQTSYKNTITMYAEIMKNNIALPELGYYDPELGVYFDFFDLLYRLSVSSSVEIHYNGEGYGVYTYMENIFNNVPIYLITASNGDSSVVGEYIMGGTVPIIFEPVYSISTTFDTISIYQIEIDNDNMTPQNFDTHFFYPPAAFSPTLSFGVMFGDYNQPIIGIYYITPIFAAFYNIAMFAPTATSLPTEWRQAPDIMQMYLPQSAVVKMTYPVFSRDSNGLPRLVTEVTNNVIIYFGNPLPYTFTTVTLGRTLYSNLPDDVTISTAG